MIRALAQIAYQWGVRAFGGLHMVDPKVRALRLLEEAAELAQAAGVPEGQAALCVQHVYKRPPGNMLQEMGGVFVTALVFCEARGWDPEQVVLEEVQRVLAKPFAQRNQAKLDAGLTGEEWHTTGAPVPYKPADGQW